MLGEQRERVHGLHGEYLERKYPRDIHYFNDILHHYSLSDNTAKKLKYLKLAASLSKPQFDFHNIVKYFSQLIRIATDSTLDELILKCAPVHRRFSLLAAICRSPTHTNSVKVGAVNDILDLSASLRCSQWLSMSHFRVKVKASPKFDGLGLTGAVLSMYLLEVGVAQTM